MPCAFCGASFTWLTSHGLSDNSGRICNTCNGRFQNVNLNPNAIGTTPLANHPTILLAGIFQNLGFTNPEINAMVAASTQQGGNAEDIWGLGFAAYHHTVPHANIVVVYTRQQNSIVVQAMGRHTGRGGNDEYRILRRNGSAYRATR